MQLEAMFPCRPVGLARDIMLLGRRMEMAMHACAAEGSTFAVGALAVVDVRDVGAALGELREAAARNLGVAPGPLQAIAVPGMTPNALAGRAALMGQRPDGSAVVEHLAVFAHGARVYQAMVVGNRPQQPAVELFFSGLRLVP